MTVSNPFRSPGRGPRVLRLQGLRRFRLAPLVALLLLVACGTEQGGEAEAAEQGGGERAGESSEAGARLADLPNPFGEPVEHWGELPGGREWGSVSGVHVDPAGEHIWVAERCGANSCADSEVAPVLELDPSGQVLTAFGAEMFARPHGVHVDDEGTVWVADDQGHRVVRFSPDGEILLTLGMAGMAGDPPGHLTRPSDVVVGQNGDIFVAEGHSSDSAPARITKFSSDGTYLRSWGGLGSGPGEFRTAHALALDSRGRLFVADRGNNRVQIFDQDGAFIDEWSQFGRPNDVFIDSDDRIYVVDAQSDEETNPGMRRGVYIGRASDGEVTAFLPADEEYNPDGSEGLALDAAGNLYVGEIGVPGMTKYVRR